MIFNICALTGFIPADILLAKAFFTLVFFPVVRNTSQGNCSS